MGESWSSELVDWVRERAVQEGFDAAGVAELEEAPGGVAAERLAEWVAGGRAGEMEYLKRRNEQGVLLRASARLTMPWARSVVVCALNYNHGSPTSLHAADAGAGWIARYAWSGDAAGQPVDYHDDLLRRLRAIETALRGRMACETRCYVDTGPLLERDLAAQAGIGWVGKNTCVLNQRLGSWLLLGVIVTSLEVESEAAAVLGGGRVPDRCGSCTRCIEACPTDALVAPREMDARLCISYLTIEKKGSIAEELRGEMGRQVFGCDICQEVCPWNRRAPLAVKEGLSRREELVNPPLAWLGAMSEEEFRREFRGSPLQRTKRHRLQRNVAIAMGNSGEQHFRPQLEVWARGEDAVLAETARWALERLHGGAAGAASIGESVSVHDDLG